MSGFDLVESEQLRRLANEHAQLLTRQLEEGPAAVEDALIVRVETMLLNAAKACPDVAAVELAYDATSGSPALRMRSGEWLRIPVDVEATCPAPGPRPRSFAQGI